MLKRNTIQIADIIHENLTEQVIWEMEMGAPRWEQEFQVFWWGWSSKRRNRTRVMTRGKEWKKWTMEDFQEFALWAVTVFIIRESKFRQ